MSKNNKVNVLFINHSIKHGGPGKSLFYLLKSLDRIKINPYVLIPEDDIFSDDLKKEGIYNNIIVDRRFPENIMRPRLGIKWSDKSGSSLLFYISIFLNIIDLISLVITSPFLIKKNNIDLIYCNGTVAKIIGAFIGLFNWCPVIWHVRNIQLKTPMIITINLLSMLPVVKRIICVSIPTKNQFKYAGHKTVVINNGIDIEQYNPDVIEPILRREYKINKDTIIIGTTGRIVQRKKYEYLIDIAKLIRTHQPEIMDKLKFIIIGNTPYYFRVNQLEKLKDDVSKNNLNENFIFTGYKSDVKLYVADFDIFILTSDYPDPFPRSVIEAMALSKPIVGYSIGGITESVINGENGMLCENHDLHEMYKAVIKLIEDKDLRIKMGTNGKKRAERLYRAEDKAKDIQNEILDVL